MSFKNNQLRNNYTYIRMFCENIHVDPFSCHVLLEGRCSKSSRDSYSVAYLFLVNRRFFGN